MLELHSIPLLQHNPASMSNSMSNSTVTMSGNGGNGFPQIKTDMMYTHAAAAAAAGIPVSAGGGGGSPTSGLSNSRLHQVRPDFEVAPLSLHVSS